MTVNPLPEISANILIKPYMEGFYILSMAIDGLIVDHLISENALEALLKEAFRHSVIDFYQIAESAKSSQE